MQAIGRQEETHIKEERGHLEFGQAEEPHQYLLRCNLAFSDCSDQTGILLT